MQSHMVMQDIYKSPHAFNTMNSFGTFFIIQKSDIDKLFPLNNAMVDGDVFV
jgi:hypothetical protein